MSRILRGQALGAVSPATTAAYDLMRVQGAPDEEARDLIDEAVSALISATIAAMEAIGFEDGEDDRHRLYLSLVDYNGAGHGR